MPIINLVELVKQAKEAGFSAEDIKLLVAKEEERYKQEVERDERLTHCRSWIIPFILHCAFSSMTRINDTTVQSILYLNIIKLYEIVYKLLDFFIFNNEFLENFMSWC